MTKKILLLFGITLMTWVINAWSFPYSNIYINVGTDFDGSVGGDSDTKTDIFQRLSFYDETYTEFYTDGTFSDKGYATVIQLLTEADTSLSYLQDEIMRNSPDSYTGLEPWKWEMTIYWENLTGSYSVGTDANGYPLITANYDPGAKFYIMIDTDFTSGPSSASNFGTKTDITDNTGFKDGTLKLTAEVTKGHGTATVYSDTEVSRNLNLYFKVTQIAGNTWFLENNTDLQTLINSPGILSFATEGGPSGTSLLTTDTNGNPVSLNAYQTGTFGFAVPEPATLILLGSGLLAAGVGGRIRKKRS